MSLLFQALFLVVVTADELCYTLLKEKMNTNDTFRQLRAHQADFANFKVKSLAIFGSVARGEARPESDVDILVDFEGPATFDQYMQLRFFLEELLGCHIDLLTRKGIRPELLKDIEQEALYVS